MAKTKNEEETEALVLDVRSFNSAERLECQVRFDATFGDLLAALYEAIDPDRETVSQIRIEVDGDRAFPDQIVQFMLWVQAKRDDPDVSIEAFDDLTLAELNSAFVRGMAGKASKRTRSKRSSPEPDSASSSTG